MFTIAFTTATNYLNKREDTELLLKAESIAKAKGCVEAYVPLSKKHPFEVNDVFQFWKDNKYKKVGTISWVLNPKNLIDCYLFKKKLSE